LYQREKRICFWEGNEVMRNKLILSAGLALSISVMSPRHAAAASESLDLSFSGITSGISSDYALLFSSEPGTETFEGYAPLASIPTGSSTQSVTLTPESSSGTVPTSIETNTPIDGIVLVGVYDATEVPGVTVGVSTTFAASIEGESFSTVTAPISSLIPSESIVVGALESPSSTDLSAVLGYIGTPIASDSAVAIIPIGGSGDLVDFSDGTLNGTLSDSLSTTGTTPPPPPPGVPLPAAADSALAMLGVLAGASLLRRKIGQRAL
jgi:hypothetical protein